MERDNGYDAVRNILRLEREFCRDPERHAYALADLFPVEMRTLGLLLELSGASSAEHGCYPVDIEPGQAPSIPSPISKDASLSTTAGACLFVNELIRKVMALLPHFHSLTCVTSRFQRGTIDAIIVYNKNR